MIDRAFAEHFAVEWIAAWNSHDLDRILAHYADDFEFTSPIVARIAEEPSGRLKGRTAVEAYWARALRANPRLQFRLNCTLVGVRSVVVFYQGVRGPAAEYFAFNAAGKVVRSHAHYA